MSFFKRLLGDPATDRVRADQLFAEGNFGPAKLVYEKIVNKIPESERATVRNQIAACLNGIAEERIEEAKRLVAEGDLDLARNELLDAIEVAADEDIAERAQHMIDTMERDDALDRATTTEMTDEDRLAMITGSWSEAQADEYDSYGDELFTALLHFAHGRFDESRSILEAMLENAKSPRYLYLEVARARSETNDPEGTDELLRRFLSELDDEEIPQTQFAARMKLAELAYNRDGFDAAMQEYQELLEFMPEDYRSYFVMGVFLRREEEHADAVEILSAAADLVDDLRPDWQVFQELGLAHRDAGNRQKAIDWLEQVISVFVENKVMDFPPLATLSLARLHEENGKRERAADMFASLTRGSDTQRHALYHYEAGRNLRHLGLLDEARRMLKRAEAILNSQDDAPDDDDEHTVTIEQVQSELDALKASPKE